MTRVDEALREGRCALQTASESAALDAEVLLAFAMGRPRLSLYAHPEEPVEAIEAYRVLLARRVAGEPVEYLTGSASFFGLEFEVTPAVLIPRPETELLVEKVAALAHGKTVRIADIGTGSGVIAVMLARLLPTAQITAVDISPEALAVARRNAVRHGVADRIEFRTGDLLKGLPAVDWVVSNPPYIATDYPLSVSVRYEPSDALFGGVEGWELPARLIAQAKEAAVALLACEMGYDQREVLRRSLDEAQAVSVEFFSDYSGYDRGFIARW